MSLLGRKELVGALTKRELEEVIPDGIFTNALHKLTWESIISHLRSQPDDVLNLVFQAKERKAEEGREIQLDKWRSYAARRRQSIRETNTQASQDEVMEESTPGPSSHRFAGESLGNQSAIHSPLVDRENGYLQLPSQEETKNSFRLFRQATSNDALAMHVCFVCAREKMQSECECIYGSYRVRS